MDSENRQDLQQNDLREFLFHFNQWWNKHGTQTLLVILVIVASVVGIRWFKGKDFRENEAAWADFAGTSSPEGLAEVAQRYEDRPGLAAFALLRASDLLAEQAAAVSSGDTKEPAKTPEERKRLLERSIALAQQAINTKQPTEPSLVTLNARMRLAADYETLGQWDKAGEQYETIRKEAGPYKTIASQADQRLQSIAINKQPVVLPQAPAAPAADADKTPADGTTAVPTLLQPATEPAPTPAPAPAPAQP